MWSMVKAIFRTLLLRDYTPGRARTPKQVIGSLLIPILTIALFMAAVGIGSLFLPVSDAFRDAIVTSSRTLLVVYVIFYPLYHGLAFRIRIKRDLRNALLSIVIYFPIFTFALTTYLHLMQVLFDRDTPFLAFSWFEVPLAVYFSAVVCILTLLTYRIGSAWAPPPAVTAHRYYQRTEKSVSLGSLIGIAIVLLLAS